MIVYEVMKSTVVAYDNERTIGRNNQLPLVDRVYATEIDTHAEDGDTFFPEVSSDEWYVSEQQDFLADERNRFAYSFVTYLRRNPIDRLDRSE